MTVWEGSRENTRLTKFNPFWDPDGSISYLADSETGPTVEFDRGLVGWFGDTDKFYYEEISFCQAGSELPDLRQIYWGRKPLGVTS